MGLSHALSRLIFGPLEGRRRHQSLFQKLHAVALVGMNYGRDEFSTNGELEVMRHVHRSAAGKTGTTILFDVGANTGGYSAALLDQFSTADAFVHAFEPSAQTYAELVERLHARERVALHNFGFSDANLRRDLYSSKGLSGLSSVYPRVLDHRNIRMEKSESIELRTLDDFCMEESIGNIHFLKLDVEGHELNVLRGAERMLREGRISSIQWEFGGCNIDSRTYFRDFFYLLIDQYRIYRVVKDGIYPVTGYWESLEIFETVNYFAELRS
jgi:FkbM family methyltransferase